MEKGCVDQFSSNRPASAIRPTPASKAAESFQRSWAWNWSSGRRSLSAMQRKVPAEKASVFGRDQAADELPRNPTPTQNKRGADGDHHREAEVHQVGPASGDAGPEHQADDRQGVGRLVDQGGDEDPERAGTQPLIGPDGAGQGDPAGQRVQGQAERRGPPVQRRPLGRRARDHPAPTR